MSTVRALTRTADAAAHDEPTKDKTMDHYSWPRARRRTNIPSIELEPWPWQESYDWPTPYLPPTREQIWRVASRRRFALDCLGMALVLTVALLLYAAFTASGPAGASPLNDNGTTPPVAEQ